MLLNGDSIIIYNDRDGRYDAHHPPNNSSDHEEWSINFVDSAFLNDWGNHDNPSTAASKLQIQLNNSINTHKAPLKMYNEVVDLFNKYISSKNFDKYARLKSRKAFIQSSEKIYNVSHLKPTNHDGLLEDGGWA